MNVEILSGPPHLDRSTLEQLRLRLEHERQRLIEELTLLSRPADIFDRDEPGDIADLATRHPPPEVENELHAQYEDRLRAVERSLARMEAGTYGLSDRTGEPIPRERLEAVPWATD